MRKVLNTLGATLLLTLISLPLSAQADEVPEPVPMEQYTGGHDSGEIEDMHIEIEQVFTDYSGILIPPVVIDVGQPSDPNIYVLPTLPEEDLSSSKTDSTIDFERIGLISNDQSTTLDPYKHAPIPIDSLKLTTATPTDEFMDGARIFGAGLALAALTLTGITGLNTIRSRRRKASYLSANQQ